MKNFKNFSQSVGKSDQPVHEVLFLEIAVRVLCIVWVSSHSFGVRIVHRLNFFVSLLCEECFDKFSELFSTESTGWGIESSSLSIFVGVV